MSEVGRARSSLKTANQRIQGVEPDLLLDLSSGAPLLALELSQPELLKLRSELLEEFLAVLEGRQNPVTVAARWDKQGIDRILPWLSGYSAKLSVALTSSPTPLAFTFEQRFTAQESALAITRRSNAR